MPPTDHLVHKFNQLQVSSNNPSANGPTGANSVNIESVDSESIKSVQRIQSDD
jgi:hypothetical protein